MPLVGRCGISFSFEYVSQMSATVAAHDLRAPHSEGIIGMPSHGTGDTVEVGRPAAARLKLVIGSVQRCIAACAGIHAG